jgi:hypothetical protein
VDVRGGRARVSLPALSDLTAHGVAEVIFWVVVAIVFLVAYSKR